MRIHQFVGIAALTLASSGCSLSEHGLCPPDGGDQAVFDEALVGDWLIAKEASDRSKDNLTVNVESKLVRFERLKEGSKSYKITTPDAAGKTNSESVVGHLVSIGGARFLDVLVGDPKKPEEKRHALLKVKIEKGVLALQMIDPRYLAAHPTALASTPLKVSAQFPPPKGQDSPISLQVSTITAPTADLRKFLEEHANDPELWPKEWTVECRRPEARPKSDPQKP